MLVYFNTMGQIQRQLEYGQLAYLSATNYTIFVVQEGYEFQEGDTATLSLKRPDGTLLEAEIFGHWDSVEFSIPEGLQEKDCLPFVEGQTYHGFRFSIDDMSILNQTGTWKGTVSINPHNSTRRLLSGLITIYVNETEINIDGFDMTYTEYIVLLNKILEAEILNNNIMNGDGIGSLQQKIQKETFNTNVDGLEHTSGASGEYSALFGGVGEASGKRSMAVGGYNVASGQNTFVSGEANKASARTSSAFGSHTQATAEQAFATGTYTVASGASSFTSGQLTVASGNHAVATGIKTEASGKDSFATGYESKATGEASFAEGSSKALADFAHSEGDQTEAKGKRSHTEGCMTKTLNAAEGTGGGGSEGTGGGTGGGETVPPTVPDDYVPEYGFSAHAEGFNTVASGSISHSEGNSTKASGHNSHAEGLETVAKGYTSHAQGYKSKALGDYSFAAGIYTEVTGNRSIGIGGYVNISGNNSVGIGYANTVSGDYHYAFGTGLYVGPNAPKGATHVGAYAASSDNTVFAVGIGTDYNDRKSAFLVYQDGHAEVQTVGNTDNSLVTKKYLEDNSGGTKLYEHEISLMWYGTLCIISNEPNAYNFGGSVGKTFKPAQYGCVQLFIRNENTGVENLCRFAMYIPGEGLTYTTAANENGFIAITSGFNETVTEL